MVKLYDIRRVSLFVALCLYLTQCYSQMSTSLSYNREDNVLELKVTNDTAEDIVICDNADGGYLGTRISFSYSMDREKFALYDWIGLRERPDYIALKAKESLCSRHQPDLRSDKRCKYMLVEYKIVYYTPSDKAAGSSFCDGVEVFEINRKE